MGYLKMVHTDRKLKIVILCDYFEDYHENRASYRIRRLTAESLAKRGQKVVFIYPCRKSLKLKIEKRIMPNQGFLTLIGTPGIFPMRFRTGGFAILDGIVKVIYCLATDQNVIQVVSGHRPSNLLPCIMAKYLKGSFTVDERWEWLGKGGHADRRKTLIGRLISLYDNWFELRLKKCFDAAVVISSHLKKRFGNQEKVYVLPGGAENKNLKPYETEHARKQLGLPEDGIFVGLSNLIRSDHEDNEPFFYAFKRLCRDHIKLKMIATGTDTEYAKQIERDYELDGRIIFPGYIPYSDYNLFLSACNAFVLAYPNTPINRSRWPNKLGDYLCLRRPVITNPTGDIEPFFEKFKLGLLCEPTADGFYHAIRIIIDENDGQQKYARDCELVVNKYLSFENRIDTLLNIFFKGRQ